MRIRLKAAFTLIELLVVIAVILVLIALLFPTMELAHERARRIICLNNLRQFSTSCLAFATDNQGWLPRGRRLRYSYQGVSNIVNGVSSSRNCAMAGSQDEYYGKPAWPDTLNTIPCTVADILIGDYGFKTNSIACASMATVTKTWGTSSDWSGCDRSIGMDYYGRRADCLNDWFFYIGTNSAQKYEFPFQVTDRGTSQTLVTCPLGYSSVYGNSYAPHVKGQYVSRGDSPPMFGVGNEPPDGLMAVRLSGQAVWAPWKSLVRIRRPYDNLDYWFMPDDQ